jgi:hypothetical protein
MPVALLSRRFRRGHPPAGGSRPTSERPAPRLAVEPLEDRALPSVFSPGAAPAASFREAQPLTLPVLAGQRADAPLAPVHLTTVAGRIFAPGQRDIFRFVAAATGQVTLQLQSHQDGSLNGALTVFDDGRRLIASGDGGPGNVGPTLQLRVTAGQTYYVQVAGAGAGAGRYNLVLALASRQPALTGTNPLHREGPTGVPRDESEPNALLSEEDAQPALVPPPPVRRPAPTDLAFRWTGGAGELEAGEGDASAVDEVFASVVRHGVEWLAAEAGRVKADGEALTAARPDAASVVDLAIQALDGQAVLRAVQALVNRLPLAEVAPPASPAVEEVPTPEADTGESDPRVPAADGPTSSLPRDRPEGVGPWTASAVAVLGGYATVQANARASRTERNKERPRL